MSNALRISRGAFGRVALLDMDRSLVRHAHPHCHVLLKMGGDDTQFLVGDRHAPLTDTTAVLVNAWETHAYVHDPARRNAVILALYIEPTWLHAFRRNWAASGGPGFFAGAAGDVSPRIRALARTLAEALTQHAPHEALLSALMIAVIERFTPWRSVAPPPASDAAPDWRIRRAVGRLIDGGGSIGVRDLAREAGLSRTHFFRLFGQSTGLTPHVFLNMLRVERAVAGVAAQEEPLAAIGTRLGFASPTQFSRFFRDHVSVSPRAFRSVLGG